MQKTLQLLISDKEYRSASDGTLNIYNYLKVIMHTHTHTYGI
jgi:hypothetical protein